MINRLKKFLPKKLYYPARSLYRYASHTYNKSIGLNTVNYCGLEIDIPKNHLLNDIAKSQPYREFGLRISVRFIGPKYENQPMVDIGANIGDTAIVISSECSNDLVLIEPSDYYHEILVKNVKKIKNKIAIHKCFVGNGDLVEGRLVHVGSTAHIQRTDGGGFVATLKLEDLTIQNPCLIKIDTDGFDFSIIRSGLSFIKDARPAIYFENSIRTLSDLTQANEIIDLLHSVGYEYFVLWDDAGFHMLSTNIATDLKSLNRYLYKTWTTVGESASISNFDILALTGRDADIFFAVKEYFEDY